MRGPAWGFDRGHAFSLSREGTGPTYPNRRTGWASPTREQAGGTLTLSWRGVIVKPTTTAFTSRRRLGVNAPLHAPEVGHLTHVLALLYEDVGEHLRDGVVCAALRQGYAL